MSTIYAKPGDKVSISLTGAPTGLAGTMGVTVLHKGTGTPIIARFTAGITELPAGSGRYETNFICPAVGEYVVFWDNGEIGPATTASEDLISTHDVPNEIVTDYDVETDLGFVRLLISDIGGKDGTSFIFSDGEIEVMLARRSDPFAAAATLLRTIAANEAMVSKRIKFMELETDGPAVSKELRELATSLEQTADDDAMFEIVTINADMFSRRDIILNRLKRESA